MKGKINTILVGAGSPSEDDIKKMFGWSAHKFGQVGNLPEGHLYKEEAPKFDVPPAPDLPTVIGEFFQGGYYIGDIEDQGQMYKVLVAPIEADVYGLQWGTTNSATAGTDSLTDGWSNTWSMNIGDHPAASHCLDYRGGGHDDWYMPAKNELNLFWLNIAPSKTQVPEFQTGGEQALHGSLFYWTSTQYSSYYAWLQRFSDGGQYTNYKSSADSRVRPVRRLPFTP